MDCISIWFDGFKLLNEALGHDGADQKLKAIGEILSRSLFEKVIELTPKDGQLRSLLYAQQAVVNETVAENGNILMDIRLEKDDLQKLLSRSGIPVERFIPQTKEFWQK